MWIFENDAGRVVAALILALAAVIFFAFLVLQRRRSLRDEVHPIHRDETGGPLYKDIWGLRPGQTKIEDEGHHQAYDDEGATSGVTRPEA